MNHIHPMRRVRKSLPRSRALAAAVGLIVLISPLAAGCGSSPGGPVIGDILAGVESTANGIIGNASGQGQVLLMTAAGQVDLAVDNARSAYAEELDKTLGDVDETTQRTIRNLQDLEDDLRSDSIEVLNTAIAGAQQVVNTLPFANRNPQVTSYSPHFASSGGSSTVQVSVSGNFFWAYQENHPVKLELDGHRYEANLVTTSTLGFEIPTSELRSAPDRLTHVSAQLTVPYEKGLVFKSVKPGVFQLLFTVLPPSPVKALTLTTDVDVTGTESRTMTMPAGASMDGGGWRIYSWDDCQSHDLPFPVNASPGGWQIDPSSAAVHISHEPNPNASDARVVGPSATGFVIQATTTAHCFLGISNGSGDITFYATYTETRPTTTRSSETRDLLPLNWGDQRVLPVPNGRWTVHAELWNGTVREFSSTDTTNPYLSVVDGGDSITVQAAAPETLLNNA